MSDEKQSGSPCSRRWRETQYELPAALAPVRREGLGEEGNFLDFKSCPNPHSPG